MLSTQNKNEHENWSINKYETDDTHQNFLKIAYLAIVKRNARPKHFQMKALFITNKNQIILDQEQLVLS